MTSAVVYQQHGKPLEVLKVVELEVGEPGRGEVLVSRIVAPINPADLNAIEGTYPIRPSQFPAVPGVEGVGIVERVGPGVEDLREGMAVILPHYLGTWREAAVVDASLVTVVPKGIPLQEAVMLKINPATAWRMLHDFVKPEPGAWVIQNASNSAVGRHVIAMAKELGLKTINLVRRPELFEELTSLGADAVILDDADVKAQVAEVTGGQPVLLGLNAVGGESGGRVASVLAEGGTLVTYGAMSRQALKLPAGWLIFKDLAFRGFWVSKWYERASAAERDQMFAELFELVRRGVIRTPVERQYALEDALEAVARAQEGHRDGKILLGHHHPTASV